MCWIPPLMLTDPDLTRTVCPYTCDLLQQLRNMEKLKRIPLYMDVQPEITVNKRSCLVDWLFRVHRKCEFTPNTLYLSINYLDRFLSKKVVLLSQLQLVGSACMFVACKMEETEPLEANDLVILSDNNFDTSTLLVMERILLKVLEFDLHIATPWTFFQLYLTLLMSPKATPVWCNDVFQERVRKLLDSSLFNYSMIVYTPSLIAAAACFLSLCDTQIEWNKYLSPITTYSMDILEPCVEELRTCRQSKDWDDKKD